MERGLGGEAHKKTRPLRERVSNQGRSRGYGNRSNELEAETDGNVTREVCYAIRFVSTLVNAISCSTSIGGCVIV